MSNYENGVFTRKAIVTACKKLFYEKGFNETSYGNICKEAHVNRSTIYYHFKDKEEIRYEVQWEYIIDKKRIAETICPDSRYHYILAVGMLWLDMEQDEKLRSSLRDYCKDFPGFAGEKSLSYFFFTLYDAMWKSFHTEHRVSRFSLMSAYALIIGLIRIYCENPNHIDVVRMYEQCIHDSARIIGIPQITIDEVLKEVRHYLTEIRSSAQTLPEAEETE